MTDDAYSEIDRYDNVVEVNPRSRPIVPQSLPSAEVEGRSAVQWNIALTAKTAWHAREGNVISFTNAGRSPARILAMSFVGSSIWNRDDYPMRWHVLPGNSLDLVVETADPGAAWVVVAFTHALATDLVCVEWLPLVPGSELSRVRAAQIDSTSVRRRWFGLVGQRPPGKAGLGPFHDGTSSVELQQDDVVGFAQAFGPATRAGGNTVTPPLSGR